MRLATTAQFDWSPALLLRCASPNGPNLWLPLSVAPCCSMVNTLGIVIIIPREALQLPVCWPPRLACLGPALAVFACALPCRVTGRVPASTQLQPFCIRVPAR